MGSSDRLAAFIEKKKLSYAAFARLVGADRARIQRVATGERGPGRDLACAIEQVTGIPAASWSSKPVVVRRPRRSSPNRRSNNPS